MSLKFYTNVMPFMDNPEARFSFATTCWQVESLPCHFFHCLLCYFCDQILDLIVTVTRFCFGEIFIYTIQNWSIIILSQIYLPLSLDCASKGFIYTIQNRYNIILLQICLSLSLDSASERFYLHSPKLTQYYLITNFFVTVTRFCLWKVFILQSKLTKYHHH